MVKLIVTFGQSHVHRANGKTFDANCVCVIEAPTLEEADAKAFKIFEGRFHQHIDREKWDDADMHYFPRGYINLESN